MPAPISRRAIGRGLQPEFVEQFHTALRGVLPEGVAFRERARPGYSWVHAGEMHLIPLEKSCGPDVAQDFTTQTVDALIANEQLDKISAADLTLPMGALDFRLLRRKNTPIEYKRAYMAVLCVDDFAIRSVDAYLNHEGDVFREWHDLRGRAKVPPQCEINLGKVCMNDALLTSLQLSSQGPLAASILNDMPDDVVLQQAGPIQYV